MKINKILLLLLAVAALSSCTSIDLEDMPKPQPPVPPTPTIGKVKLTTDWTNRTDGIVEPTSYTVIINNKTLTFNNSSNALPELNAGTYPIHIYNIAEKISINGTAVSVTSTGNNVEPLLGWLFTSAMDVLYEAGKEKTIIATMQQQVRQLTLTLKPKGGAADQIETITASLSGVAGAWDFKENKPAGNAMNVPLVFTKQVDGSWKATVRLLGTIGAEQKLTGTIKFAGNTPSDMSLNSDLSTALLNFNTDKMTPMSLNGDMEETPTEAGFSATINDWQKETKPGTAN